MSNISNPKTEIPSTLAMEISTEPPPKKGETKRVISSGRYATVSPTARLFHPTYLKGEPKYLLYLFLYFHS